jgi:hypothetical protein
MGNSSDDAAAAERQRHHQLTEVLGEPYGAEQALAKLLASWLSDREMHTLCAWISASPSEASCDLAVLPSEVG